MKRLRFTGVVPLAQSLPVQEWWQSQAWTLVCLTSEALLLLSHHSGSQMFLWQCIRKKEYDYNGSLLAHLEEAPHLCDILVEREHIRCSGRQESLALASHSVRWL